mgnify:CR=1 FL=1
MQAIARHLSTLIKKHKQISIAVAWGELTGVAEELLANTAKFQSVLLGVDFSATDPDLIDRLVDVPNAFVAKIGLGASIRRSSTSSRGQRPRP